MNLKAAMRDEEFGVVGGIERSGSKEVGKDLGLLCGEEGMGVYLKEDLGEVLEGTDLVIDFSTSEGTLRNLEINKEYRRGYVIGTTGFSEEEEGRIRGYGEGFPIVLSPNFSIGANVLYELLAASARRLGMGMGYDIEIFEWHHRFKKDVPSGTALKLGEVGAKFSGLDFKECVRYRRGGEEGVRGGGEIGIISMRGGDMIGEHRVVLCGLGESIELKHQVSNRGVFSKGALLAGKWLIKEKKKEGVYSMEEVLGLSF